MSLKFAVVDIFSPTAYKGNPLAVVDALDTPLTDTQLKLVARQFNLSETTFFSKPRSSRAAYRLRSLLPDGKEVLGIGHNILGAWWFLAQGGFVDFEAGEPVVEGGAEVYTVYQELGDDVMPVRIARTRAPGGQYRYLVSIAQATPKVHGGHANLASLAESVGLETEDIGVTLNNGDTPLAPRVVSTSSTHHLLVPVKSASALDRVVIQRDKLLKTLKLADDRAYGIYLYTPHVPGDGQVEKDVYRARFFSPGMSTEDPATGSAAGPLTAFLHHQGLLELVGGEANVKVLQGQNIGRECVIRVKLSLGKGEEIKVELIGDGVSVSEGAIAVPDASLDF